MNMEATKKITAARDALEAIEKEAASIDQSIRAAQQEVKRQRADAALTGKDGTAVVTARDKLAALEVRADELPYELLRARAAVAVAEKQAARDELEEVTGGEPARLEALKRTEEVLQKARADHDRAHSAYWGARSRIGGLQDAVGRADAELSALAQAVETQIN